MPGIIYLGFNDLFLPEKYHISLDTHRLLTPFYFPTKLKFESYIPPIRKIEFFSPIPSNLMVYLGEPVWNQNKPILNITKPS
ncbi:hypothetical protein YC2023_019824 [Brassica napus]